MPPRKSSKKAAGLTQPILSFSTQRKSSLDSKKIKSSSSILPPRSTNLRPTASDPSLESSKTPTPVTQSEDEGFEVKENVEKVKDIKKVRKELDGNGKEWNGLMKKAEKAMDGKPIHAGSDTHTKVHHILRVFDMTAQYGPCVGITRLQRWERAKKWGLNPPEEIRAILTTAQGEDDPSYRENVLHAWV